MSSLVAMLLVLSATAQEPESALATEVPRDVWTSDSDTSYGGYGPTLESAYMGATDFGFRTCVGADAFDVTQKRRVGVSATACLGPRIIRSIEPKVHVGWETTTKHIDRIGVIGQAAVGLTRADLEHYAPKPYVSLEGGMTLGWTPFNVVALDTRWTVGPQVVFGQGVGYRTTLTTTAMIGRLPWQKRLPETQRLVPISQR